MNLLRVAFVVGCAWATLAPGAAGGCRTAEYLYAAAWSPSEIHRFCVESDGSLTPVGMQAVPGDIHAMTISEDRTLVYVGGSNLRTFAISWTDGSLTLVDVQPIGGGTFADLVSDGSHLYGTHSAGGSVLVFDVASGLPQLVQTRSEPVAPRGLAVVPASNQVVVANGSDFFTSPPGAETVAFYGRGKKTGLLESYGYGSDDPAPDRFAVSPSGNVVYFTLNFDDAVYSMVVSAGIVAEGSVATVGDGSSRLALDSTGTRLYVANGQDGTVSVLAVDGAALDVPAGCPGAADDCRYAVQGSPVDLLLGAGGSRLYVAGTGSIGSTSTMTVFSRLEDGLEVVQSVPVANPNIRRLARADLAGAPEIALTAGALGGSDDVDLEWNGAAPPYHLYRSSECAALPGDWLLSTDETSTSDPGAPAATLSCYRVYGAAP